MDENSNYGSFSLMGEKFQVNTCKITNHGKEKGLFTFTLELNSKDNDKQIYLKFRSINNNFKDVFSKNYTYGEAPGGYSAESFVKIGKSIYNLSDGIISIVSNYIVPVYIGPNIHISIKSNTQDGIFIEGAYEGLYDYVDNSINNDYYEIFGDGSFSFSYTDKTYLLSSGFLFYFGLDIATKKRNYKLYLTNEDGDYLQFEFSSDNILGANLEKAIYRYPENPEYFNNSEQWLFRDEKFTYGINSGDIGIKKTSNHYEIMIRCGYNIYKYFSIVGNYSGSLINYNFSNDMIDYKRKNYQIKSVELTYDGEYRNLFRYNISIQTTMNDKINLKVYTNERKLAKINVFDEIVRESFLYDSYDSFIDISNEPYIGFWHVGEMSIDTPDKASSFVKLDFRGRDEDGNFINIIYNGLMAIRQ